MDGLCDIIKPVFTDPNDFEGDRMSLKGVILPPIFERCPYIEGLISINETLRIDELDDNDLDTMLSYGFRHFGGVFFRPLCHHCRSCISIRIPIESFKFSKSIRRLFRKNINFRVAIEKPVPSLEAFELYTRHKRRFKTTFSESYEQYVDSFYTNFPFSRTLTIKDGDHLVAVSHLDVTANSMSAIYCYFDENYSTFSPGKFAVYKEIEYAKQNGIPLLYLGYYVPQNIHMNYKIQFKPNQLMIGYRGWFDYMDFSGNIITPFKIPDYFELINQKADLLESR